jgi:hypothetical protein
MPDIDPDGLDDIETLDDVSELEAELDDIDSPEDLGISEADLLPGVTLDDVQAIIDDLPHAPDPFIVGDVPPVQFGGRVEMTDGSHIDDPYVDHDGNAYGSRSDYISGSNPKSPKD